MGGDRRDPRSVRALVPHLLRRRAVLEPSSRQALHAALERGLSPIGAGLLLAGVVAIVRIANAGLLALSLAAVSALVTVLGRACIR